MTRLYVPLDVTFFDDPKIIEAGEAATLLYVVGLAKAKTLKLDGILPFRVVERFGLRSTSSRIASLIRVGLWEQVDGGYRIVAWLKHNKSAADMATDQASRREGGLLTSHNRWHKATGKSDPTCSLCIAPATGPAVALPIASEVEQSEVERSNTPAEPSARRESYEDDFTAVWHHYPRKVGKPKALKAYQARRRAGDSDVDLLAATKHFAASVAGTESRFIMHASRFFGADEEWRDFVNPQSAVVEQSTTATVTLSESRNPAIMAELRRKAAAS